MGVRFKVRCGFDSNGEEKDLEQGGDMVSIQGVSSLVDVMGVGGGEVVGRQSIGKIRVWVSSDEVWGNGVGKEGLGQILRGWLGRFGARGWDIVVFVF